MAHPATPLIEIGTRAWIVRLPPVSYQPASWQSLLWLDRRRHRLSVAAQVAVSHTGNPGVVPPSMFRHTVGGVL